MPTWAGSWQRRLHRCRNGASPQACSPVPRLCPGGAADGPALPAQPALPLHTLHTLQAYLSLAFALEALLMGLHKKHTPLDRTVHEGLFYGMAATAGVKGREGVAGVKGVKGVGMPLVRACGRSTALRTWQACHLGMCACMRTVCDGEGRHCRLRPWQVCARVCMYRVHISRGTRVPGRVAQGGTAGCGRGKGMKGPLGPPQARHNKTQTQSPPKPYTTNT